MTYLVTGATGFIGRHLVEQLLRNRDGDVHVVVREGSRAKLDALLERWPHSERVRVLAGDLEKPRLAVGEAWVGEHGRRIKHVFHLAAIYDVTAPEDVNERLNVTGNTDSRDFPTRRAIGDAFRSRDCPVAGPVPDR